mmetsp:Transcript_10185/g.20361  ORF Transcript_10185/g.20361 Transcript_10185/m.20361 type:complete len:309 (-) Transcript_10185:55-981(-)
MLNQSTKGVVATTALASRGRGSHGSCYYSSNNKYSSKYKYSSSKYRAPPRSAMSSSPTLHKSCLLNNRNELATLLASTPTTTASMPSSGIGWPVSSYRPVQILAALPSLNRNQLRPRPRPSRRWESSPALTSRSPPTPPSYPTSKMPSKMTMPMQMVPHQHQNHQQQKLKRRRERRRRRRMLLTSRPGPPSSDRLKRCAMRRCGGRPMLPTELVVLPSMKRRLLILLLPPPVELKKPTARLLWRSRNKNVPIPRLPCKTLRMPLPLALNLPRPSMLLKLPMSMLSWRRRRRLMRAPLPRQIWYPYQAT